MAWLGLDGLAWMDLSKNTTPPRAPCGANKGVSPTFYKRAFNDWLAKKSWKNHLLIVDTNR